MADHGAAASYYNQGGQMPNNNQAPPQQYMPPNGPPPPQQQQQQQFSQPPPNYGQNYQNPYDYEKGQGQPVFAQQFKLPQGPKWHDIWAGLLFLLTCAGFVAVSGISIQGYC